MKDKIKSVFIGDIEVPDKYTPGIFKTHDYVSFKIAPSVNNDNSEIDTILKSFGSVKNNQMFKGLRGGQPVISFELYGNHKDSYYMVSVPRRNKELFKERLDSAFEGGGVAEYEHTGWPFVEDDPESLLAYMNLSKESFFPLRMDNAMICKDILHVTEELREGEESFLQIIVEPIDEGWQDGLERAYESYLHGNNQGVAGGFLKSGGRMLDNAITEFAAQLGSDDETDTHRNHRQIKEVNQKLRQPGYHVFIRVTVRANDYHRRNDILEGIAGAIKGSSFHNAWQTSPVIRKKHTLRMIRNRQTPLLHGSNLLCEDELKVLLRFPTKDVQTRKLQRMRPDENKVDDRVTRNIIAIGKSIEFDSPGQRVGFSIDNDDTASKGRLFIAAPGGGKSTLVKTFKNGAMEAGHGGSLFDVADGTLYRESIESTPPEDRGRLVLVNFADDKYPHIFNFSSLGAESDVVGSMFAEFFEVFYKTASNYRMNSFLRKASMTAFINPDATFLELILLMKDSDYRKKFLPTIRKHSPDLYMWWKTDFPKLTKNEGQLTEILQPILYRLDSLQYNNRLGPIFCGRGGKLEIAKWMNEGKWVLYNISNGAFLENEQRMLMSFLNYGYWAATLQREKLRQQNKPLIIHHKIYDEPQTYMNATPIFELSISKSRKYRVSDNFFIQNPTQVIDKSEALWQQIIGMNPHILVGGGLDNKNLKIMAQELNVPIEQLKQLEQLEYHWFFKTYIGKSAIPPFILDASGLPKEYGRDKALERKWQQHFAPRTIDEVKLDNQARGLGLSVEEYLKLIDSFESDDDEEEGVPLG